MRRTRDQGNPFTLDIYNGTLNTTQPPPTSPPLHATTPLSCVHLKYRVVVNIATLAIKSCICHFVSENQELNFPRIDMLSPSVGIFLNQHMMSILQFVSDRTLGDYRPMILLNIYILRIHLSQHNRSTWEHLDSPRVQRVEDSVGAKYILNICILYL